ncbi:MAG: fumarate reductase subunit C [Betaproteobacteria bacterium]|nr:fumarate reductase subunit C [Betaproteobacteria bacterium]
MSARPYVRSMRKWWMRDPFFIVYMAREVTAIFVAAYALVLLTGLVRLSQGEAAWNAWLLALKSPVSLVFHVAVLATFLYHTWSWFCIMPKTMPLIFVGEKKLAPEVITGTGLAAACVACAAVFVFVRVMQ